MINVLFEKNNRAIIEIEVVAKAGANFFQIIPNTTKAHKGENIAQINDKNPINNSKHGTSHLVKDKLYVGCEGLGVISIDPQVDILEAGQQQVCSLISKKACLIAKACRDYKISNIAINVNSLLEIKILAKTFLELSMENISYKTTVGQEDNKITKVQLLYRESQVAKANSLVDQEKVLLSGKALAHRLSQQPANMCSIEDILSQANERLNNVEVLDFEALKKYWLKDYN